MKSSAVQIANCKYSSKLAVQTEKLPVKLLKLLNYLFGLFKRLNCLNAAYNGFLIALAFRPGNI